MKKQEQFVLDMIKRANKFHIYETIASKPQPSFNFVAFTADLLIIMEKTN